jgi:hypothetical protein
MTIKHDRHHYLNEYPIYQVNAEVMPLGTTTHVMVVIQTGKHRWVWAWMLSRREVA